MVALNQDECRHLCQRIDSLLRTSGCVDSRTLRVETTDIGIRIEGIAYSIARRVEAYELATQMAGAYRVINELSVEVGTVAASPSDGSSVPDEVAQQILELLVDYPSLEQCEFAVSACGDQYRVNGYVRTPGQKALALEIASTLAPNVSCKEIVVASDEFGP